MTLRVKYYLFRFAFRVTGWDVLPLLVGRGILCTRRRDSSELIMVLFTGMVMIVNNDGVGLTPRLDRRRRVGYITVVGFGVIQMREC